MSRRNKSRQLALFFVLFGAAALPSVLVARAAFADGDDDDDTSSPAQDQETAAALAKKRAAVLKAIPTDETILINVTGREMPASPDVLNLGRKGTRALARCLSDNVDDGLRALCAQMLGRVGDRGGLAALQGALEAWDSNVRHSAIVALRRIPDASSVDPLAKIADREDEEVGNRAAALEALGVLSERRAVAILRARLQKSPADGKDDDEEAALRLAAFHGIWKSRHLIGRRYLVADVTRALGSKDAALALAGTFAASELRAPELAAPLIKLMQHPNVRVRNHAVYALGKIGDRAATTALLAQVPRLRESRMLNNVAFALERLDAAAFYKTVGSLAKHSQAQIRMNAAFVLGDVRRAEGLPLLEGVLDDKNDSVRLAAIRALGKLQTASAEAPLEKFVDDKNPSLKKAAIYAIYALSNYARKDLVFDKLYSSKDPSTKLQAAIALGKAKDPRVASDLITCVELDECVLSDVDSFLRASPSGEIPGRTLLAWTKGRTDLTDLVGALKPQGTSLLARSEAQASLARHDLGRAYSAIDLTGDMTDPQAIAVLTPLLAHDNRRLRLHAAVALARAGQQGADAVLWSTLDDLPEERLPSAVRLLSRVSEPSARTRLTPELAKREASNDVPLAVAAAAVHLHWDPDTAIFKMLSALQSQSRQARDLAERYLLADDAPIVTELLRRAFARESNESTKNQLRRILDIRAEARRDE